MKQLLKSATALVGLSLFLYLFIFFAWEATKVATWQKSGEVRSRIRLTADSTLLFRKVDSLDFVQAPLPVAGDTILAFNGTPATNALMDSLFEGPNPPWTKTELTYLHDRDTLITTIITHPPTLSSNSLIVALQILRFLITFFFVSVALWAFFKRPDSAAVRVLAMFSFSMAAFMITGIFVLSGTFATFQIPFETIIREVLNYIAALFSAFWLNLIFLFPHPNRFMRERPVFAYLTCYLPILVLLAIGTATDIFGLSVSLSTPAIIVIGGQVLGGLILLLVRFWGAENNVERRQTRLVMWGSGFGLLALITLFIISQYFQDWFTEGAYRSVVIVNIAFAALLVSPVSFAYAFGRYRLLEVEGHVRRGTRYVLATILLVAAMTGMGFAMGTFLRRYLGEEGGTLAVLVAALAILGVFPLLRTIFGYMERIFYPERQRLRNMFHDFLQNTYTMTDSQTFWNQIESRLQEGLAVQGVYPLLRVHNNGHFYCRDCEPSPFTAESDLVARLEHEQRPIMVDEMLASSRVALTMEETTWLAERRVALVLPLITRTGLVGFLGLGSKIERDDYAAEELRILSSLASQVALASENIRLIEENVGKKRLEEQLEIARRIQHGFLPQQMPSTPGLEIAARSRFCLEVAGDYYDVIPLSTGETVMAVGDVSGKGAGAALLMANLQASLRTAVGMGVPLPDVVARINELIYHNTPPEEYITFFVCVFNPATNKLSYINAGHNPPLVRHRNGNLSMLDAGGFILGFTTDVRYQQGEIEVVPGDVILMYTDGVSEAMNTQEEEFGEHRIRKFLSRVNSFNSTDALKALETEVMHHRESGPLEDDFTILLVKRI
ncbi:MAG: PP2C family protein-serine/threonine phosphatase [Calditrichota bacterium]